MDSSPSNDAHQHEPIHLDSNLGSHPDTHLDTPPVSNPFQRHSIPDTLFNSSDTTHNATTVQSEERYPRPSTSAPPDKTLFPFNDAMELEDIKKTSDHYATTSSQPGPTTLLVPTYSQDGHEGYMNSLPPPPPYGLKIEDLTIGTPTPASHLPIHIPAFLFKKGAHEEGKTIVRNVSASCASGEMLAIIGGSGSGKTTVLNAIVGRLANLPVENGSISYLPSSHKITKSERKALTARKMKDKIGFVKQQDTLLEHLTVRETLSYAAALRLPREVRSQTRETIVAQTIEELGLRDVADTIVGGALRKGISGGERRRLSIGCALVSMPSVLVADESTTGLDAFTAYALLLTLSQLAKRNRTVILTLHQPRSATFPLFDRILLLSRGRVVFSGPRQNCLPWFASLDLHPVAGTNPMDWLIDISTVDTRAEQEEESRERVARLVRAWEEGGPTFVNGPDKEATVDGEFDDDELTAANPTPYRIQSGVPLVAQNPSALEVMSILSTTDWDLKRIGLLRQTGVLLSRAAIDVSRNYGLMLAFTMQAIILGTILGFAFYQLPDNPAGIQSLKTLCLQHLPYFTYLTLIYSVYRYCNTDLIIFDREREDNLYAVGPWLISEIATNLPVLSVSAALFAIIVYFMVDMRSDYELAWALGIFVAENILAQLTVVAFALIASSLNRIYASASTIVNSVQIFMIMTAGLFLLHPPVYINWMRFISPYYYGFRAIAISQFRDRTFACEGIQGAALNQCDGNQVLAGLYISHSIKPGYYLAGLTGLMLVSYGIAGVILALYEPGGVKHAAQLGSSGRGKESMVPDNIEIVRQRIDVEVRQLSLQWSRRTVQKPILHNITAKFPSGAVTAVMGPSGAGKSSLLQLLAGRHMNAGPLASFKVDGHVLFNGRPRRKGFRSLVAFVEQEDAHHLPALTVRETLRYAAILRLPHTMTRKRKIARAEEVLQMLGLSECADNVVGGELLKGISGGEKRRLSLAVEMISDPAVLVVDEPTSGLDAMTAKNVMLALKAIAASGRTVIASIHQPRSDIWHAGIDRVVLLAKGGRTAFSCPKEEIGPMCTTLGYPLPEMVNPADWLLDLVSIDTRGKQEEVTRNRVSVILDSWAHHEEDINAAKQQGTEDEPSGEEVVDTMGETPMLIALPVILERMLKNLWRQQQVFWMRLYQPPLLAVIFLIIYLRLKHGPTGAQDRLGFIFEIISPMPFVGVLNNIAVYPADRDIFFHEVRSSAAYSTATFVIAFTLIELPSEIMAALLTAVIANVGAGMQTNARIFFQFALAQWAVISTGESIGLMFGSFTRSMGLNVSLVSTFITIAVQLCGILSITIPTWLSDLAWSTTLKYAARIIMLNECIGLRLNCTTDEITSGQCLVQTGEELLALLGWKDRNISKFCGLLVGVTVVYRLLAWAVIRTKVATLH